MMPQAMKHFQCAFHVSLSLVVDAIPTGRAVRVSDRFIQLLIRFGGVWPLAAKDGIGPRRWSLGSWKTKGATRLFFPDVPPLRYCYRDYIFPCPSSRGN